MKEIWSGEFKTCPKKKDNKKKLGFKSEKWINKIKIDLETYKKQKKRYSIYTIPPRPSNLSILFSAINASSVLDIGGSNGWSYYYLNNSLNSNKVKKYTILEVEPISKFFSQIYKDKSINYEFNISKITRHDILYMNSTLQYFEDNYLLKIINLSRPKFILIDDFLGGKIRNFYSYQNYYDDQIPVKFRNISQFKKKMINNGYSLNLIKDFSTEINGNISYFPKSKNKEVSKVRNGLSLMFKKI